jgi:hypothetical protein
MTGVQFKDTELDPALPAATLLPLLRQQDELHRRVEFLKESIKEQAKEVAARAHAQRGAGR